MFNLFDLADQSETEDFENRDNLENSIINLMHTEPFEKSQKQTVLSREQDFYSVISKILECRMDYRSPLKTPAFSQLVSKVQKYDEESILNLFDFALARYLNKYKTNDVHMKNNKIKIFKFFYFVLPKNDRSFIFKIHDYGMEYFDIIKSKIYVNALDKNKNNILFYCDNITDLGTYTKLDVNLNQINFIGDTFLHKIIKNCHISALFSNNEQNIMAFIYSLREKNFNFNIKNFQGDSIFTIGLKSKKYITFLRLLLKERILDLVNDKKWLHYLVHDALFDCLIPIIFEMSDIQCIFNALFCGYDAPSIEEDFSVLIYKLKLLNLQKTREILIWKNPDTGNTFMHKISEARLKKLLKYVLNNFEITVGKNKQGLYPIDLYDQNKFKNKLSKIIEI